MFSRRELEGDTDRSWRSFLPSPPPRLKPLPARLRRFVTLLWFACLAGAILIQAGATWRLYVYEKVTNPPFAALGLEVVNVDAPDWQVRGGTLAKKGERPRARVVYAIDGVSLPPGTSAEEAARLVRGPEGQPVRLGVFRAQTTKWPAVPPYERVLTPSAANREKRFDEQQRTWKIVTQAVDLLLAGLLLVVAALLKWRRPNDPVATPLSFALLFLATLGGWRFWEWARLDWAPVYLNLVWLSLLLVALPALPSGRYVPRLSGWFMVLGPVTVLLLVLFGDDSSALDEPSELAVMALIVLAVLVSVVLRFRETPSVRERQRMKWALLGFAAGTLLVFVGGEVDLVLPEELSEAGRYLKFALTRLGYAIMPIGLLFSVLGYRLNDVDAAIGRSTAYAAVTTLVGVVWAVGAMVSNDLIKEFGKGSPIVATAISTVVAVVVFVPSRARILAWTEARFQRALLRLRSLPERIARWQNDDDPQAVAARALDALVECVDAKHGALIRDGHEGPVEILAVHKISPEAVRLALAADKPRKRSEDAFPLRLRPHHQAGRPVTLLIGPREDGASYSKQERSAVSAISEPLADAIHAVSRRAAITLALTRISDGLDRIQQEARR
jgi:hypothetical protein